MAANVAIVRDPKLPHDVNLTQINKARLGNGKTVVATAFERVFGYSLTVDPLTHRGPMCVKSEANATHDGRSVLGPLSLRDVQPHMSYQRLVNTRRTFPDVGPAYEEFRVVLVGGEVTTVFRKRKREAFGTVYLDYRIMKMDEVFSEDENMKMGELARDLRLDIGEFDALRDTDGLLYVVDATNSASFEALRRYAPKEEAAEGARLTGKAVIAKLGVHKRRTEVSLQ